MSETSINNSKKKEHELPLPLVVLAVIGLVIVGFIVAFYEKIFKRKDTESDSAVLQSSQDQEAEKESVPNVTESSEETQQSEDSVLVLPEQTPTEQPQ